MNTNNILNDNDPKAIYDMYYGLIRAHYTEEMCHAYVVEYLNLYIWLPDVPALYRAAKASYDSRNAVYGACAHVLDK